MNLFQLSPGAVLLGGAAFGAMFAQLLVARRCGRRAWWAPVVGLALVGMVLLPARAPDAPLVALLALVGFLGASRIVWRVLFALLLGGATYAIGRFFPGGTLAFAIAVVALSGVAVVFASVRRLRRMARAEALVPGEPPAHEVELGGTVRARELLPLPGDAERSVAAWELMIEGKSHRSSALVPVVAEAGTVLVDPHEVRWDLSNSDTLTSADRVAEAVETAGIEPAALGLTGPGGAVRNWLEDGAEVYVVGRPSWRADPLGSATYRAAPTLPLFAGPQTFFADRPEAQLAAEARFRMISWMLWLPPLIVAAVLAALR